MPDRKPLVKTYFVPTVAATALTVSVAYSQDAIIGQAVKLSPLPSSELVIVGQGKMVTQVSDFKLTYGPSAEDAEKVVGNATNVADVYKSLGAPYSVDTAGQMNVYRWGNGTTQLSDGLGTLTRNELLVFTGPDGAIEGFSYKNKANMTGLEPLQMLSAQDAF
ncbi:MAG: hypothetical protein AAF385_12480 [Pseudomonadota bacterium]